MAGYTKGGGKPQGSKGGPKGSGKYSYSNGRKKGSSGVGSRLGKAPNFNAPDDKSKGRTRSK